MSGFGSIIVFIWIAVMGFQFLGSSACRNNERLSYQEAPRVSQTQSVSPVVLAKEASRGLDLKAVSALAKNVSNAEEFEKKLNTKGYLVNNLDLNQDGVVDYINVTEYGEGDDRGLSLTTQPAKGEEVELATISFTKSGDQMHMQTHGNKELYGNNHYYRSNFGLSDLLLYSYLFSNHNPFRSMWGYGNYPQSYGRGWAKTNDYDYRSSTRRAYGSSYGSMARSSTPSTLARAKSPNAQKKVARATSLTKPSTSMRSFKSTSSTKPVTSGGFGRPSSSQKSSSFGSSSQRSPFGSSSSQRSSFGGSSSSRSLFGSGGFGRTSSSSFGSRSSFGGGK